MQTLKIATWNVNSLGVRLPHVLDWLSTSQVDVLCLQELKLVDEKFPFEALKQAGYTGLAFGQKTYNGVAVLVRDAAHLTIGEVVKNNPLFVDEQSRLIAAQIGPITVVSAYFPNGQEVGSEKFAYKMHWLEALKPWLTSLREKSPVVLAGDFNITLDDRDVHDPVALKETIHCSTQERTQLQEILALGFVDGTRVFTQEAKQYTWWDYRMMAFRRNTGLRIDYVLADLRLNDRLVGCTIDKAPRKWEKPSDHTPVILELSL